MSAQKELAKRCRSDLRESLPVVLHVIRGGETANGPLDMQSREQVEEHWQRTLNALGVLAIAPIAKKYEWNHLLEKGDLKNEAFFGIIDGVEKLDAERSVGESISYIQKRVTNAVFSLAAEMGTVIGHPNEGGLKSEMRGGRAVSQWHSVAQTSDRPPIDQAAGTRLSSINWRNFDPNKMEGVELWLHLLARHHIGHADVKRHRDIGIIRSSAKRSLSHKLPGPATRQEASNGFLSSDHLESADQISDYSLVYELLRDSLRRLGPSQKLVAEAYYGLNRDTKTSLEIAMELNVTESRISQLRKEMHGQLRQDIEVCATLIPLATSNPMMLHKLLMELSVRKRRAFVYEHRDELSRKIGRVRGVHFTGMREAHDAHLPAYRIAVKKLRPLIDYTEDLSVPDISLEALSF